MKAPDPYARHRTAIHEEFGRVTPFRMGRSIGLTDDTTLPCPYKPGSNEEANFQYAFNQFFTTRKQECSDGRTREQAYREDYFDKAGGPTS